MNINPKILGEVLVFFYETTKYDIVMTIKIKSLKKNILTKRQIEYLALASLGYSNDEISKLLYVSKSTVKKTFEVIFEKLHAKNKANAVAITFIHNLITLAYLNEIQRKYVN